MISSRSKRCTFSPLGRGGWVFVNLDDNFDFDSLLEEPIDDVRERFNISMENAIVKEPGDLWCGDMGAVGSRHSDDMVVSKASWFQKILAKSGKNVEQP